MTLVGERAETGTETDTGHLSPAIAGSIVWLAIWTVWACSIWLAWDAITYLAAGERLNAGHLLYALSPGDRPVELRPPYWSVPLLYPPAIAVLWRPLGAVGIGLAIWQVVTMSALAAAVVAVLRRGWWLRVVLLAPVLAIQFASGNVAAFIIAVALAVGLSRDPRWGIAVGVLGAIKIVPLALVAVYVARRDWRGVGWTLAGLGGTLAITVAIVGVSPFLEYARIATSSAAQPWSASYLTGIAWLSPAILVVGTLGAMAGPARLAQPIALLAITLGTPALSPASLATLLAIVYEPRLAHHQRTDRVLVRGRRRGVAAVVGGPNTAGVEVTI